MKSVFKKYIGDLKHETGFALPSVLYIIVLLSLVALTILSLQYFMHYNALLQIAKVKAEYAAESGIALVLSELSSSNHLNEIEFPFHKTYQMSGESFAELVVNRWGYLNYTNTTPK